MKKQASKIQQKLLLLCLLCVPGLSFAASSNKLVSIFDNVITFLTSTLARGVGVTAIAAVGYLYLFENKISKVRAISIVAAIGIILGAPAIYDTLAG